MAEGEDLLAILRRVPVWDRSRCMPQPYDATLTACWPAEPGQQGRWSDAQRVAGLRDWANQSPGWEVDGAWRGLLEGVVHDNVAYG
jgi:hypothetical protein